MDKSDAKKLNDRLFEIKEALTHLSEIRASLNLFINSKSHKLRECIDKKILIEIETGEIRGKVLSVDNHWITIEWSPQSPAEDKTKHFTDIAIDRIEAFGLVEDEKPKVVFDQEGLKDKIIKVAKPNGQTS